MQHTASRKTPLYPIPPEFLFCDKTVLLARQAMLLLKLMLPVDAIGGKKVVKSPI